MSTPADPRPLTLYVAESASEDVRAYLDRANVVATSMIAYPETRAALARRRRERALRPAAFAAAKRKVEEDWPKYVAVQVTEGYAGMPEILRSSTRCVAAAASIYRPSWKLHERPELLIQSSGASMID